MRCFGCGKVYAIGILKAFELPDRKDQTMMIWMGQESTLSLFPLSVDHLGGIFLPGWIAAGWVSDRVVSAMPVNCSCWCYPWGTTVKAARTEFASKVGSHLLEEPFLKNSCPWLTVRLMTFFFLPSCSPACSLHWVVQFSMHTLARTGKDILQCLKKMPLGASLQAVCRAGFEFKMI